MSKAERAMRAVIPGKPRGQGSMALWRGDDGKERAKYGDETINARNLAVSILRGAWGDRPPLAGAVGVRITARFPRPKSHFGTGRNAGVLKDWAPHWVIVPTDGDKIARLVNDALTIAGVVADDAIVALLRVEKVYADSGPGETRVEVFDLTPSRSRN